MSTENAVQTVVAATAAALSPSVAALVTSDPEIRNLVQSRLNVRAEGLRAQLAAVEAEQAGLGQEAPSAVIPPASEPATPAPRKRGRPRKNPEAATPAATPSTTGAKRGRPVGSKQDHAGSIMEAFKGSRNGLASSDIVASCIKANKTPEASQVAYGKLLRTYLSQMVSKGTLTVEGEMGSKIYKRVKAVKAAAATATK